MGPRGPFKKVEVTFGYRNNMKNIKELITDINHFLGDRHGWFTEEVAKTYSEEVTQRLARSFGEKPRVPSLRLSQMGARCPRSLWYSIHLPELAEALPPSAVVKFSYGHLIEALVIAWAKEAGHEVTGEQDELILDGVAGHRDCVIDGCVVDVKSAASRSFLKFKDGSIAKSDTFGYLDQLDGYLAASLDDPLVRTKDRGYLLAVDKQLGHMCLYEHKLRENRIRDRIREYKRLIGLPEPPACTCGTEPDGQSGNIKLDVKASYNNFKYACFPNLRTFLYSDGPRYLTKVSRIPRRSDGTLITEVDKNGQTIYN